MKVIGYVSLAVVVSLVGITYQVARTIRMTSDERALSMFDSESNSAAMKAYVSFIAE